MQSALGPPPGADCVRRAGETGLSRYSSPLVLVDEAVEVQFGRPAEAEEGVTDILLHLGSDRPRAIPILVVALAAIGGDKVLLDAHLEMARHIVEDVHEPLSHTDGLVVTIHRTVGLLGLGMVQVDARADQFIVRRIGAEQTAQAMLAVRTSATEAHGIGLCLLAEDVFPRRLLVSCFTHDDITHFLHAKVILLSDSSKTFREKI